MAVAAGACGTEPAAPGHDSGVAEPDSVADASVFDDADPGTGPDIDTHEVQASDVDLEADEEQPSDSEDADSGTADASDVDPWDSPLIRLHIAAGDWGALHVDVTADIEVPVIVTVHGETYTDVGLELQGYSSRYFDKKNFKLKFDDEIDLGLTDTGLEAKKLILKGNWKDHTLIREQLSWRALAALGQPVPATGFVHLIINDEDYGLYVAVEAIDDDYFDRRGYAEHGNLYKGVNQKANFSTKNTLAEGFEKKEGEDPDDWSDLAALVDLVHALPETPTQAQIYEGLDPIFDVDLFLDRIVWLAYTQNSDGVSQNFYLYNEPGHPADHWVMVAWDGDLAFSAHWKTGILSSDWWDNPLLDGNNFLSNRLVANDAVRSELVTKLAVHLGTTYSAAQVRPWVEELEARVGGDIARDLELWDREYTVDEVLAPIYTFVENRPEFLLGLLDGFAADPDYEP